MNKENWTSCEILNCSIRELDLSEQTKLRLMDELFNIQDETFELQDRIDKAIEYIEKYCIDGIVSEYNRPQTVFEENGNEKDNARTELLNILKGD